MENILDKILSEKIKEVEQGKREVPISELKRRIARRQAPLDFASALRGDGIRLIAEVKRASPSKGLLCPNFDPVALARAYARGGAAAISVLTEIPHFQGSLDHLVAIRQEVKVPLLRKDFIFDPYQVYESAAFGADGLLLIVAALNSRQLKELLSLSLGLGLNCLVEVRSEAELDRALQTEAEIIGINNRDLNTFAVDIGTTHRLRPLIPPGRIVVAESGISGRGDVAKLRGWGVNAVLVGEALVTSPDIAAKMKELIA